MIDLTIFEAWSEFLSDCENVDQCQNLINCTPTPPLTQH